MERAGGGIRVRIQRSDADKVERLLACAGPDGHRVTGPAQPHGDLPVRPLGNVKDHAQFPYLLVQSANALAAEVPYGSVGARPPSAGCAH